MFDKEIVRARIKEHREKAGISPETLAVLIGTSKVTVYRWESGVRVPELESLWKLADYYGLTLDALVGRER